MTATPSSTQTSSGVDLRLDAQSAQQTWTGGQLRYPISAATLARLDQAAEQTGIRRFTLFAAALNAFLARYVGSNTDERSLVELARSDEKVPHVGVFEGAQPESRDRDLDVVLDASSIEWAYNAEVVQREAIERIAANFEFFLGEAAAARDTALASLSITEPSQALALRQWNETARDFPDKSVDELIAEQAARTPDKIAIELEGERLTYAELERRAEAFAARIAACELPENSIVGVLMERSLEIVVAFLGIMKSGHCYLPLDPNYPEARVHFMIEDSAAPLIVTQEALAARVPKTTRCLLYGADTVTPAPRPRHDPGRRCYIIYTSGSTGTPKGVEITHRNLANLLLASDLIAPAPDECFLCITTFSFDIVWFELFCPLIRGGRVSLVGHDTSHDGEALREVIRSTRVTVLFSTPSRFRMMLDAGLCADDGVEVIVAGGEVLPAELARALQGCAREVWNFYGPTEVTIYSAVYRIESVGSTVPIGQPPANTSLYILDSHRHPLPIGVVGELYIGGAQVARGYLDREQLTAERFLTVAGLEPLPVRVYRTGDLCYRRADGNVEYVARADNQIKLRGFRIELGEIEAAVRAHPDVGDAVVVVADAAGGQILVAYVASREVELDVDALRASLTERLPPFMVPSHFVVLEALPMGPTGKLDRNALPAFDQQVRIRGVRIELGEIEATLVRHPSVRESAVVVREESLVAYVVAATQPEQMSREEQASQLRHWQDLYDDVYDRGADASDAKFNVIGWNSSYTGEPIPAEHMREWVDQTVARIMALRPQRVLEIGCGTGLLLSRIAPTTETYVATDYSRSAIEFVGKHVTLPQLSLLQRQADNFAGIETGAFDVVVINSVIQYFPTLEYLLTVIEGAIGAVADGGKIFIGDVRNLRLLRQLSTAIELERATADLPRDQLRSQIERRIAQEEELLVDPELFGLLRQRFPRIGYADVQLKRGRHHNELVQFRYDVVLHIGARDAPTPSTDHIAWQQSGLTIAAARQLLGTSTSDVVVLTGIPNARVADAIRAVELIGDAATVSELRRELATIDRGVDPEELFELGDGTDYVASVTWSSAEDCCDVVLRHPDVVPSPPDSPIRAWDALANRPLLGALNSGFVRELRRWLAEQLPEHMIPAAFVRLDQLPLTTSGKINRKALLALSEGRESGGTAAFDTETQRRLAVVWSELLQVEVRPHDEFRSLGGNSLQMARLAARIRREFSSTIGLRKLTEAQTVVTMAALLEASMVPPAIHVAPRPRATEHQTLGERWRQYRGALLLGLVLAALVAVVARSGLALANELAVPAVETNPVMKQSFEGAVAHFDSAVEESEPTAIVLGSSDISQGFSPPDFDEVFAKRGQHQVTYSYGFQGSSPDAIRNMALALRLRFEAAGKRARLAVLGIDPRQLISSDDDETWGDWQSAYVATPALLWHLARRHPLDAISLGLSRLFVGQNWRYSTWSGILARITDEPSWWFGTRVPVDPEELKFNQLQEHLSQVVWNPALRGLFDVGATRDPESYQIFVAKRLSPERRKRVIRAAFPFVGAVEDARLASLAEAARDLAAISDRVVLVAMPVNPYGKTRPTPDYEELLRRIRSEVFGNVFDMRFDPRFTDDDFINFGHVTYLGAQKFSRYFAEDIAASGI